MSGDRNAYQKAMNEGHSAAWDQMWEKAIEHYQVALEEFPNDARALTNLGMAYFESQDYKQSLKYYYQSAQVDTDDPIPFENLARINERMGNLQKSVNFYARAADLYLKSKDIDKSVECWVRVITLENSHLIAHTRLATIYERTGNKAKAIEAYLASASLIQQDGDMKKAIQIINYCKKLDPSNPKVNEAINIIKNNQTLPLPARPKGGTGPVRLAEVKKIREQEISDPDSLDPIQEANQLALVKLASLLFEKADETQENGDHNSETSISVFTKVTRPLAQRKMNPAEVSLHLGKAIDLQTQGDFLDAISELEKTIREGLDHSAVYYNLGYLQHQLDPKRSLKYLQNARLDEDFAIGANLLIGQIYLRNGNYSDAASSYMQALRLADASVINSDHAKELMQIYEPVIEATLTNKTEDELEKICENIQSKIHRMDWRNYLKLARKQLPPQPQNSPPLPLAELILETGSSKIIESLGKIRDLVDEEKYDTALEEAFHSIDLAPTYIPLHILIGEILQKQNRPAQAENKLILAAKLYQVKGEIDQAIRLTQTLIEDSPMNVKFQSFLIDLYTQKGESVQSLQAYKSLAKTYYQLSDLDNAHKTYEKALQIAQNQQFERKERISIMHAQADIDLQKLDFRSAMRIYEQIRTLEPHDELARLQLIDLSYRLGEEQRANSELDDYYALLENAGKQLKVITLLEKLIEQNPTRLELRKKLADIYEQLGKIEEAVEQLDVIADSFLNDGNISAAISVLKMIVKLEPGNIDEYKKMIDQLEAD